MLGGLAVLGAVNGVTLYALAGLPATIAAGIDAAGTVNPPIMQTLTQTVTNASGDPVTITTTRLADESVAEFYTRHKAVVDYTKAH